MQNRLAHELPPAIQALFAQITTLINDPTLNRDHFTDVKNFSFKNLIATHKFNDLEFSVAGWAHVAGRQDVLDWLYQHTNQDPNDHFFLLHWAVMCRQPQAVILPLLAYVRENRYAFGNDNKPYYTRYDNDAPLHLAVSEGNLEMVRLLVSVTHDPDLEKYGTTSPLHIAVEKGDLDMVKLLALELHAKVNVCDAQGNTPLHLALQNKDVLCINALVECQALLIISNHTGNNALHLALSNGDDSETFVSMLKHQGTDGINVFNTAGKSPLILAVENGNMNLLQCWLAPQQHDNNQRIEAFTQQNLALALRAAARKGRLDIVNLILPHIMNIHDECADKPGSALSIAAVGRHHNIVKALFRELLSKYVQERENGPEYKKHTYFFVKKGAGYSRAQKVAAGRALLEVLDGRAERDTLSRYHGPLHNKSLKSIYELVNKFVFENYQPSAANAAHQPVNAASPSGGSSSGHSHSSGCDCSGGRRQSEFSYLHTASACCDVATSYSTGRGFCAVM